MSDEESQDVGATNGKNKKPRVVESSDESESELEKILFSKGSTSDEATPPKKSEKKFREDVVKNVMNTIFSSDSEEINPQVTSSVSDSNDEDEPENSIYNEDQNFNSDDMKIIKQRSNDFLKLVKQTENKKSSGSLKQTRAPPTTLVTLGQEIYKYIFTSIDLNEDVSKIFKFLYGNLVSGVIKKFFDRFRALASIKKLNQQINKVGQEINITYTDVNFDDLFDSNSKANLIYRKYLHHPYDSQLIQNQRKALYAIVACAMQFIEDIKTPENIPKEKELNYLAQKVYMRIKNIDTPPKLKLTTILYDLNQEKWAQFKPKPIKRRKTNSRPQKSIGGVVGSSNDNQIEQGQAIPSSQRKRPFIDTPVPNASGDLTNAPKGKKRVEDSFDQDQSSDNNPNPNLVTPTEIGLEKGSENNTTQSKNDDDKGRDGDIGGEAQPLSKSNEIALENEDDKDPAKGEAQNLLKSNEIVSENDDSEGEAQVYDYPYYSQNEDDGDKNGESAQNLSELKRDNVQTDNIWNNTTRSNDKGPATRTQYTDPDFLDRLRYDHRERDQEDNDQGKKNNTSSDSSDESDDDQNPFAEKKAPAKRLEENSTAQSSDGDPDKGNKINAGKLPVGAPGESDPQASSNSQKGDTPVSRPFEDKAASSSDSSINKTPSKNLLGNIVSQPSRKRKWVDMASELKQEKEALEAKLRKCKKKHEINIAKDLADINKEIGLIENQKTECNTAQEHLEEIQKTIDDTKKDRISTAQQKKHLEDQLNKCEVQIQRIENFQKTLNGQQTQWRSMLAKKNKVLDNLKQKLKKHQDDHENLKAADDCRELKEALKKNQEEINRVQTLIHDQQRRKEELKRRRLELEQLEEKFKQDYGTDDSQTGP